MLLRVLQGMHARYMQAWYPLSTQY